MNRSAHALPAYATGLKYFKYILLAAIVYMPLFGHLNTLPVRIWDEARIAISAYEMYRGGDLIVPHYQGEPDMWNTKPPLLVWAQAGMMGLIGVNELAVRLPSAIAAFFTCLALLIFSLRYLHSFWFGFIAVVVLVTSKGYIDLHAARTGDYDAMLTLFTTTGGLFLFSHLETKRNVFLYLFFVATALGVLTKSVAALLFTPALVIYCIWQGQLLHLLRNKHLYLGALSFLVLVVGYYLWREGRNEGFIAAVQANELGGRYLEVIEGHSHGFWSYYNRIIEYRFKVWHLLIPCGFLLGMYDKNPKIVRLALFSALMTVEFWLVISLGQTKLIWYDVPLYPFLAILVSISLFFVFRWAKNIAPEKFDLKVNTIPFLFLFLGLITPYSEILDRVYTPKEHPSDKEFYAIGYFMKDAVKGLYDLDGTYMLYDGYNAHVDFYMRMLRENSINISFKDWKLLDANDRVVVCQPSIKQFIEEHYLAEMIIQDDAVSYYRIEQRKP